MSRRQEQRYKKCEAWFDSNSTNFDTNSCDDEEDITFDGDNDICTTAELAAKHGITIDDGSMMESKKQDILKMGKSLEITISQAKSCTQLVKDMTQKIRSQSPGDGMSFLHMKNNLLLDYIMNLGLLILHKNIEKSIADDPAILRLVELRTVMEKIRPIDQKLKYQIDKLVKAAVEGKEDESDPLRFKANPDDLDRGEDSENESVDDEAGTEKPKGKSEVYRPPKVAPQHFDDEEQDEIKKAEKVKRKSINRALIRELQEEYLETPVEVHNMGDAYAKQLSQENRDRQRYEETFMTRLPVTKQEKHKESRLSTLGVLGDEITDFSRKRSRGAAGAGGSKSKKKKQSKGGKKKFRK